MGEEGGSPRVAIRRPWRGAKIGLITAKMYMVMKADGGDKESIRHFMNFGEAKLQSAPRRR